ncbi:MULTISPECIES: hypothetical protein [Haloarcula]|uniref:hypothetical protein n=1 Tax=Haloarcula TaxID=2237 RepID=UPI0023EBCB06|nr:hypothetical protein [Halomicroarcula sp. XH51]
MRRRQVLATLALTTVSLAGCSAPGTPGTDDGTATDARTRTTTSEPPTTEPTSTTDVTPDPDDPIAVDLRNTTERELIVEVTITRAEETVFEQATTVAAGGTQQLDTGISQTGSYEVTVAIEGGPSETDPFPVGPYDIRMGSNAIVELSMDGIRMYFEE